MPDGTVPVDRRGEWLFLIPQDADPKDPLTLARALDMKGHPNRKHWHHRMGQYEDFMVLEVTSIGSLPALRIGADRVTTCAEIPGDLSATTAVSGSAKVTGTPTTAKEMA